MYGNSPVKYLPDIMRRLHDQGIKDGDEVTFGQIRAVVMEVTGIIRDSSMQRFVNDVMPTLGYITRKDEITFFLCGYNGKAPARRAKEIGKEAQKEADALLKMREGANE